MRQQTFSVVMVDPFSYWEAQFSSVTLEGDKVDSSVSYYGTEMKKEAGLASNNGAMITITSPSVASEESGTVRTFCRYFWVNVCYLIEQG